MAETTTMVLKVDLQCERCCKKVKKVLCKFSEIRDQKYDDKASTVTITVVSWDPECIKTKIRCKGGRSIKSIEIIKPQTKTPAPTKTTAPAPCKGCGSSSCGGCGGGNWSWSSCKGCGSMSCGGGCKGGGFRYYNSWSCCKGCGSTTCGGCNGGGNMPSSCRRCGNFWCSGSCGGGSCGCGRCGHCEQRSSGFCTTM